MLKALIQGLHTLRAHMVRMLEPVSTALAATEVAVFVRVVQSITPGSAAGENWERVSAKERRRGGSLDALTHEDCRALDELFAHLGESGREQQDILLGETIAALRKNLEAAEADARESERLSLSLGLLVGLMLALIVI